MPHCLALLTLLALGACANANNDLACCTGPVFVLNAGEWSPAAGDMTVPTIPEAKP